jgi:hypothetical protein
MWDYSIRQEIEIFSVYIAAAESFVECLWIHLGSNIPAACSPAHLYVHSVPFLSSAIFTADRRQSVPVHCLHHHDECPLRLWNLCSTELIQMYLTENAVNLLPQCLLSRSDEIRAICFKHGTYRASCKVQFMKPTLHTRTLKYELTRHTISYISLYFSDRASYQSISYNQLDALMFYFVI